MISDFLFFDLFPEPDADEHEVDDKHEPYQAHENPRSPAHHAFVAESISHHEIIIHRYCNSCVVALEFD